MINNDLVNKDVLNKEIKNINYTMKENMTEICQEVTNCRDEINLITSIINQEITDIKDATKLQINVIYDDMGKILQDIAKIDEKIKKVIKKGKENFRITFWFNYIISTLYFIIMLIIIFVRT